MVKLKVGDKFRVNNPPTGRWFNKAGMGKYAGTLLTVVTEKYGEEGYYRVANNAIGPASEWQWFDDMIDWDATIKENHNPIRQIKIRGI
jgi:hypothetical protein